MSIQILHYEFLGPVPLSEWEPPMEKVVYAILSRAKDRFTTLYVDRCEDTEDAGFFTKNGRFKCWIESAGSEGSLYLSIYPMFDAGEAERAAVVKKIVSKYRPACNPSEPPPKCACCGAQMDMEREMERSRLFRCTKCGISDTRLI